MASLVLPQRGIILLRQRAFAFGYAGLRFTGKPLDDETGLIFLGARYYNPSLGRFITPDTVVPAPSNPQNLNRYSYVGNNPVNFTDPSGHKKKHHWWQKFWKSFVGAFVGAVATILLGPAGFAITSWMWAGAVGGALGGAITGGLEGGWRGALIGGALGGVLGGLAGWAGSLHNLTGDLILGGMFAGGIGYTAATDSWASFAGGVAGGLTGLGIGKGITTHYQQQFQHWRGQSQSDAYSQADMDRPNNNGRNAGRALSVDKEKTILNDSKVRAEFNKVWFESHPYNDNLRAEQGGWIIQNSDGSYGTTRWPAGQNARILPTPEPANAVASFHTHPNIGPMWDPSPSARDIFTTTTYEHVTGFVISEKSIYSVDSQTGDVSETSRW